MAEYDEGGLDARHEGQGGDEVPEVGHSVMDLDKYDHCIVCYEAVESCFVWSGNTKVYNSSSGNFG